MNVTFKSWSVDARRMLLFMVQQVFLPYEKGSLVDTSLYKTAPSGERRGQKAENNLLKIKIFFVLLHKIEFNYISIFANVYKCLARSGGEILINTYL